MNNTARKDYGANYITVKVAHADGSEVHFLIKKSIKMKWMKEDFAKRTKKSWHFLVFLTEEFERVKNDDTAITLQLRDGARILVYENEHSG
ncbi:hypothetical protein PRIPAC_97948 [Pristionchus pacificus]|uniref:Uncharacterized protein n=1 Tax=Pristionchus pacificus TaxID=54126 RepID=A0A2A6BD82_PRIPA|nr:hypothetical protein PRIPAC_97948 [Pristionchus pacificus]|eukprot:PDM63837.1 hypothetical protein PRIPAC_49810 [Pristionchus pacificus]